MAENKNIKLNDEMMAKATGGDGGQNIPAPKFSEGSQVVMADDPDLGVWTVVSVEEYCSPEDGWLYIIESNNGSGIPIEYLECGLIPA